MTLPANLGDREVQKFEENSDGEVAIRITPQKVDRLTGSIITIDYAHHEVHGGSSFASDVVDTTLANAETICLAFKTAAGTKRIHLIEKWIVLVSGYIDLIEGPTWTNQTGTKVPIYNRKRETTMKSSVLLEDQAQLGFVASNNVIGNVTGLSGGTTISTEYAFGTRRSPASRARGTNEWILKPDTQYCIRLTSTANSNAAQIILDWYEHTDTV